MKTLGIDKDAGEVYLGSRERGPEQARHIQVFPVRSWTGMSEVIAGPEIDVSIVSEYVFQEVSFDPVSQIRRGYIWYRMDSQPQCWGHSPHHDARLVTFQYRAFLGVMGGELPGQVMFTFGSKTNFTIGELVHFEPDAIGQELLTIKMRPQFGFLPRMIDGVMSTEDLERVESALDDVIQGYRSSPPASVIDRCRDALTVFLSVELGISGKDLGCLIKQYDNAQQKRTVVSNLAHTVARLHSRGKPAETAFPPVSQQQAELAVGVVAEVMVSLGWASWSLRAQ